MIADGRIENESQQQRKHDSPVGAFCIHLINEPAGNSSQQQG